MEILRDVICERYNDDGFGVVRNNDGKIVFVFGLMPDEVADVQIVKHFSKYALGEVLQLKKQSSERVAYSCQYYGVCGGCTLGHLSTSAQQQYKRNKVAFALRHCCSADKVGECCQTDALNYRNKQIFFVQNNKLAMMKRGTNGAVHIEKCLLAEFESEKVIAEINRWLKDLKERADFINAVAVQFFGKKLLITVIFRKNIMLQIEDAKSLSKALGGASIASALSVNDEHAFRNSKIIVGEPLSDTYQDIKYSIFPGTFMQVNSEMARMVYDYILELIKPNSNVINCYSGAGLLTGLISKKSKVFGIEISYAAHKSAELLKKQNRLNMNNILGDVREKLAVMDIDKSIVILDPPRAGCDKAVVDTLLKKTPAEIIYISCMPITLARDVEKLQEKYEINSVKTFDMFGTTCEVETVLHLVRKMGK